MITILNAIGIIAILLISLFLIFVLVLLLDYLDRGGRSFMCKMIKRFFHKKRKNNKKNLNDRENIRLKIDDGATFSHSEKIGQKAHY